MVSIVEENHQLGAVPGNLVKESTVTRTDSGSARLSIGQHTVVEITLYADHRIDGD